MNWSRKQASWSKNLKMRENPQLSKSKKQAARYLGIFIVITLV